MADRVSSHFRKQNPVFGTIVFPLVDSTVLNTAGALTLTAAQIMGGLILRDPNGGARTDTLPTAALLVAAIQGAEVGTSFTLIIRNTADGAETITIAVGTGGTAVSTLTTIAQNYTTSYLIVLTDVGIGSEAYSVYNLGTTAN